MGLDDEVRVGRRAGLVWGQTFLPLIAAAALCGPAHAIFKCGNAYQEKPCEANAAGAEVRIRTDERTDEQRWHAALLYAQQSAIAYVAKPPHLYVYSERGWARATFVGGRDNWTDVSPTDDIDVLRVDGQIREGRFRARMEQIRREHDARMADIEAGRRQAGERTKQRQDELDKARIEIACRGRSSYDIVCLNARQGK